MAPRKPKSLITRHDTAAESQARTDHESAMEPGKQLPKDAPAVLDGNEVARSTWRRIMREYNSIDGKIVTRLDMDLLVDYCMLAQQLSEIDVMRKKSYEAWLDLAKAHTDLKKAGMDADAVMMAISVTGAFDAIVKLDGRADRKRDLMFKLRQSLYLTPRARAGVAPVEKEKPKARSAMDELLGEVVGDVNDFVNSGNDVQ